MDRRLILQRTVACPPTSREPGESDADGTKLPSRGLRVTLSSLASASLRITQLFGRLLKLPCTTSAR